MQLDNILLIKSTDDAVQKESQGAFIYESLRISLYQIGSRARPPEIAPEKFSDSFGQNLLMINSHIMLK